MMNPSMHPTQLQPSIATPRRSNTAAKEAILARLQGNLIGIDYHIGTFRKAAEGTVLMVQDGLLILKDEHKMEHCIDVRDITHFAALDGESLTFPPDEAPA